MAAVVADRKGWGVRDWCQNLRKDWPDPQADDYHCAGFRWRPGTWFSLVGLCGGGCVGIMFDPSRADYMQV